MLSITGSSDSKTQQCVSVCAYEAGDGDGDGDGDGEGG